MLRYTLLAEARHGFRHNQFYLMFQPRVSVERNAVVGFEALLHWQHPRNGLLAPGQFVADIEMSILSAELARFLLTESIQRIAEWRARGLGDLVVSVSMPGAEIVREGFASQVEHVLKWYDVEPSLLEIDITEHTDFAVFPTLDADLLPLQQQGVRIALNHFGTGFASLNAFRRLPFNTIRLDRSFMSGAPDDPAACAIVESFVALCDRLGRTPVVDGVEHDAQRKWLSALTTAQIEGALVSPPLPANEVDEYVARTNDIELAPQ
ncbi:MAG TPA: EAL domain-containing protein [Pararobbsia sp.]|jgi:EAL domain-containing protein (putative c-di-GMP-specific phosphodiesterase class I)|nr:EAL domain-containing protein [Pararobbsia sp.]